MTFDDWQAGPGSWTKANSVWSDAARQAWAAATGAATERAHCEHHWTTAFACSKCEALMPGWQVPW